MNMRAALLALTLAAASPIAAYAADAKLAAAIAAPGRAPENSSRDGARHPQASLEFWGLKPGQTVVEISPGGGYWSEILAPYAKATGGKYYVAMGKPDAKLPAKFADKAVYGDIHYTVFSKDSGPLAPAGSADMVLTARNLHNWITGGFADKAMKDFYAVLKPGGVLAFEEHRADPKPEAANVSSGYVSTQHVIDLATKAGFKLDAKSEINANPKDTKDHPFGVWTLPPSRQSSEGQGKASPAGFDRAKYDAIGESDRMTLRFRKPG
ncbi:MAG: methyltransferase [Alphaproteobacteria bacterium]